MEFSSDDHQEEHMNSRAEAEQESSYEIIRLGRFYECVFCKRGFDTAQALGGHMNVHRKDRARNKPTNPSRQVQEDHTGPRFYQQIPFSSNDHHKHSTYATATSTVVPLYGHPPPPQQRHGMNNLDRDRRKRTNQSIHPGDWRGRLEDEGFFSPVGGSGETSHEVEIDLELRLGYVS